MRRDPLVWWWLLFFINIHTLICSEEVFSCPANCKCSKIRGRTLPNSAVGPYKLTCGSGGTKIHSVEELDLGWVHANVIHLDLSDNLITELPSEAFTATPSLQKLNLSKNQIRSIAPEAFSNLTMLKRLDLSNNMLSTLQNTAFIGLENLEKLKLNQNEIRKIKEGTFDELVSLELLDLSGNPLHCNCELGWLLIWAQNSSVKMNPPPKCGSPAELRGQLLRKLHPDKDMICGMTPFLSGPMPLSLELQPSHNQVVFEGDPLKLRCRAPGITDENSSSVKVIWLFGNQDASAVFKEIHVENRYMAKNGLVESSLSIKHLARDHTGHWHCQLELGSINKTQAIRVIVISEETKYCPQIETSNNKGRYSWPKTVVGYTVELQCEGEQLQVPGEQISPKAQYSCTQLGQWDALNTSSCPFVSETTRILEQFAKVNLSLTKGTVLESARRLKTFIGDGNQLKDKMDVVFISRTVENYLPFVTKETELGPLLVDVVSTMMNLPAELLRDAQVEDRACSRFILAVEVVAEYTSSLQPPKSNLAVEVNRVKRETFTGLTCTWFVHSNKLPGQRWFHCSTSNTSGLFGGTKVIEASIQIPASLFHQLDIQGVSVGSPQQLLVSTYENNRLFPRILASDDKKNIASCIIGTKLVGLEVQNLTDPVYVMFRSPMIHHFSDSPQPVWWDGLGGWNQDGCQLSHFLPGLLVFQCNRLGYFGLLQKIDPLYDPSGRLSGAKFRFSPPAVYVGSFIIVVSLTLAVVTYIICFPSIQMSKKVKHSLTNTWISLALLCFLFSAGINQTEDLKICQGVGLSLHYLSLSSLLWMAVTVSNMYKKLSKSDTLDSVPEDELPSDQPVAQKPLLGLYLVGWGIALIVCGISGAVNMREYAGHWHCFLTPGPALSAVFVPAGILVVFLLIFFLLIRCAIQNIDANGQLSEGTQVTENVDLDMLDSNITNTVVAERTSLHSASTPTASSDVEDPEHSPLMQLKAHIIVLLLYLSMWAAAAMCTARPLKDYFSYDEIVFSIMYAFLAISLGAFVLFFYCIARSDVRSQWHLMQCWCKKRRSRCCRTRSISDTNPALPPSQPLAPTANIASRVGPVAVSSSNSVNSSSHTTKSHNSSAAKAAVELNGMAQTLVKTEVDTGGKKSNVNLVVLHRQMYRSNNSVTEPSATSGAEMFYNPHQSTVARKFFRKQRRHTKPNNLGTRRCGDGGGATSDCDSTTRAESAVFLSSDMENGSNSFTPSLYGPGSKINNTNIHVEHPHPPVRSQNPNILIDNSEECRTRDRLGPPLERLVIGAEDTPVTVLYQSQEQAINRTTSIIEPVEEVSEEITSLAAEASEVDSDLQVGSRTKSIGDISESGSMSYRTSSGALDTSFDGPNFKNEVLRCGWDETSEINSDSLGLDSCSNKSGGQDILDDIKAHCNPTNDEDEERKLPNPHMKYASRSPYSRHIQSDEVPHCSYVNGNGSFTPDLRNVEGCVSDESAAGDSQAISKKETSV
ncbi:adhesion G protein-coupled receptor A3 [Anabrus simplex]|uniref:adhesion G protein-coupled receptor A3 n=1 Tax=Anabrus simplex TaxID=316456 RepID=UPI0035A33A9D